jgi:hypothetical protein
MVNWKLKTPVTFIIFKRPDATEKVFEVIRQVKPSKLLVIADGPRADHSDETQKCATARKIIERVDWNCEVLTNYSEVNLGCAKRVSSGLDWVFDNVEESIVLEDDCIPHPTFFRFCEELLERYRYDSRILCISGQNVQFGRRRTEYSYYFSRYNHCWGWATWRQAWKYFDFDMKLWPEIKNTNLLSDIILDSQAVDYWSKIFQATYDGRIDSWGYRWTFASWIQNGISILPNVNLVSNIGFGMEGTHTLNKKSKYANMSTEKMSFPLIHPPFIIRDVQADEFTQNSLYRISLLASIKTKIKKWIYR